MILINTKTGESWYNVFAIFAAEKMGIHRNTIGDWKQKGVNCEEYNNWILYFNEKKVTQKKGNTKLSISSR